MKNNPRRAHAEAMVIALVGEKLAPKWWKSPNRAFNGHCPTEYWERHSKEVYDYLIHYSYGGAYG